ncbi:MAG: hypothetical protein GY757_16550 [bacterium]|nr:hypothetical protein [bacterium]
MGTRFIIFLLIVLLVVIGGCKKSSEVIVTTPALVTLSSFTVSAARGEESGSQGAFSRVHPAGSSNGGYIYNYTLVLTESAGTGATVNSVAFTFHAGGEQVGSYNPDITAVFSNTQLSGNGTLTSDGAGISFEAGITYADEINVTVNYQDAHGNAGSVSGTLQNPAFSDADIVLRDGIITLAVSDGSPSVFGELINNGTMSGEDVSLVLRFYNASASLVETITIEATSSIPAGGTEGFSAVPANLNDWDGVATFDWKTSWTSASGTAASRSSGPLPLNSF